MNKLKRIFLALLLAAGLATLAGCPPPGAGGPGFGDGPGLGPGPGPASGPRHGPGPGPF